MGWASILMSLWIALRVITNEAWMTGAIFPAGTLAFAVGMAIKQRAYFSLALTLISLLLVSGLVVLGYSGGFSLALLIVAGGFFNGIVLLLGYIYPDVRDQQAGAEAEGAR
jgi:hypothetical protein